MSHALASLSRILMPLFLGLIVAGCNGSYTAFEDDADFNTDPKTVDIETENAERITLSVLQSAYLAHYHSALYKFLDASDLPEGITPDQDGRYIRNCLNSGTAEYTFTRPAGEIHKSGDRVTLVYDNCDEDDVLYDGELSARYTSVKGLNNAFTGTDTQTCLANLLDELDLNENQVITVQGDDLKFRNVASTVEVDVIDYQFEGDGSDVERTDVVLDTHVIGKNDKVVIVNEILEPPTDALVSVNGDQLYSVLALVNKKYACQTYERTLRVTLKDFSTRKNDLTTIINGSLTLFEAQETPDRVNQEIIDSSFQTRVKQGNLEQSFQMSEYRVQKALQRENNSYTYLFTGFISSPTFNGKLELTSAGKLVGYVDDDYPSSGSLEIKGRDLERILLRVNGLHLEFQVDFNGDSTGNGFSDFDVRIDNRWPELLEREFVF
jgi:hypothetical protein